MTRPWDKLSADDSWQSILNHTQPLVNHRLPLRLPAPHDEMTQTVKHHWPSVRVLRSISGDPPDCKWWAETHCCLHLVLSISNQSPLTSCDWMPNGKTLNLRWFSLRNMKSTGRSQIQIQLLPPYIHLNLPNSAPWSLNPPLILPISTPWILIWLLPMDLMNCIEVLLLNLQWDRSQNSTPVEIMFSSTLHLLSSAWPFYYAETHKQYPIIPAIFVCILESILITQPV